MFLALWIFLLALKNKKVWLFLISGIILGFSVLIRPIAVFLILFLLFGVFVLADKDKKINSVLNLFFGFLLIVLPWILLASFIAGHFVIISSIGSSTFLDGMRFGIKTGSGGDTVYILNNVKDIMQKAQNSQITREIDVLKFIFLEFVRSPIAMLELLVFKLARSWYATSELWLEKEIFLIQLPYLLTAIFGLAFIFKKNKKKFISALPILLIIIYFWLITTATLSIARYTIPVMGFVIIFSAVFIDKIFEKFNIYEKIGFSDNSVSE
jgi:4-amino-4-deoxy-L-arabinose transferase-like glycosyltransferase